jgi:transposase
MAKFTQSYPTDLQYTEWQQIEQYFPASQRGQPHKWELWLIVNAIFYVTRTRCQWPLRVRPKDYAPWQTVYGYCRRQ